MTQSPAQEIEVRHCATLADYAACVRLEHLTWGSEIAVPSAVFVVAHHTGGQVLGAFHGSDMVGFTLALAGVRAGKPFLHSHMTAVLPVYRDRGVGRRLKLLQRDDALARGVEVIEWTFDPLELKNAHFNFVKLGAVARRYIPDCYGVTESPLHAGLPTDRLVAEWWIASERVKSILSDRVLPVASSAVRISLPANLAEVKASDLKAAARIQTGARKQFQKLFAEDYVVTGIERRGATSDYILEPAGAMAGLQLAELTER